MLVKNKWFIILIKIHVAKIKQLLAHIIKQSIILLIAHVLLFFYLVGITVMFSERMYSVNENAGPAQPVLVLSNPSSMTFTVQIRSVDNTATSK